MYYKGYAKATRILLASMISIKTNSCNISDAGSTPASSTKYNKGLRENVAPF